MKTLLISILLLFGAVAPALAFPPQEGGAAACGTCHTLQVEEAQALLQRGVDRVLAVGLAEVPGFFVVDVEKDQRKYPLYVDFGKKFVFAGNLVQLADGRNMTALRQARLNRVEQVDIKRIPLDDALLLGSSTATKRVVVITDPQCPFCKRLHAELQRVVASDPDVAFLIKLYPLATHPNAYNISKSIVCAKSLALLEESFADKPVPPAACSTNVVDETIALIKELGINSTPTMILSDGKVVYGTKTAEEILQLLGSTAKAIPAPPEASAAGH